MRGIGTGCWVSGKGVSMGEAVPQIKGKGAEYARILRDNLPELRERYGVEYLGIFGS